MSSSNPSPEEELRQRLVHKLAPERFTAMSGKMAAIVGYILDEPFTGIRVSFAPVIHTVSYGDTTRWWQRLPENAAGIPRILSSRDRLS
jgi:hypothetical protein